MDTEQKEELFWSPIRKHLREKKSVKRFSLVTTDQNFEPPDLDKIGLVISNIRREVKVLFLHTKEMQESMDRPWVLHLK